MAVITNDLEFAVAVEIDLTPPLLLWTGSSSMTGDLVYSSKTYKLGEILDVSNAEVSKAATNEALTLSLSALTPAQRNRYIQADPGPQRVVIHSLWREYSGGSWNAWQEAFTAGGVLSTPAVDGDAITIEIAHTLDTVDRGIVQNLSDSEQRERFPGDEGLYLLPDHGGQEITLGFPA